MNADKNKHLLTSSQCYLNQEYVLALLADDLVLVSSLLTTYLQTSPYEIEGLKQAVDAYDLTTVRVRTHRLYGLLRYFGAQDIEDMLLEMGCSYIEANQPKLQASYLSFFDATHILEQEIHGWLEKLGTPLERGGNKASVNA